ncbi:hypothetical protein HYT55_02865 [Candidatus Woesearchaeota archaeon]|nr:hypothetical protein [Candidatus Woesearchaeota archaeon]
MLYIHQLSHLTPKMADLESVYLVREIKGKTPYPLREDQLKALFNEFFVLGKEIGTIERGLELVEPTVELVKVLLQKQSSLYENINLQRAVQMLKSLPLHLQNNLLFLQEFQIWQGAAPQDVASLFNRVPQLRTMEEKVKTNEEIKKVFGFLLRNPEFFFQYQDVVNEGQVSTTNGLQEGMEKGFFFHVTLEEATKKLDYDAIKRRIPREELDFVEEIEKNIEFIKEAIDTAYKANMRVVNLVVVLYAYIKWLSGK